MSELRSGQRKGQNDDMVLSGSHWGTFRARTRDGQIVDILPFEHDPSPTPIMNGLAEAYNHPTRISHPSIRESVLRYGPGARPECRGTEPFVEVSWDEALDLVSQELLAARAEAGNTSIMGGSQGWSSAGRLHHAKTQVNRFLSCFGGFTDQINGYSHGAAKVVLPHIVGNADLVQGPSTSWPSIIENASMILCFGGIAPKNAQVLSGGCGEHSLPRWTAGIRDRHIRVVSISPIRDDMAQELSAEWWPIVPGTDTALMLALAHTLLDEDLFDRGFLTSCCVGFDKVLNYLRTGRNGSSFDADWAATLTQFDAASIRALARDLARQRSFIAVSWSLQRADNGEQTYWAAITLAAMLGQIGLPGGGIGFGYGSGAGTVGSPTRRIKAPEFPKLRNPTGSFIPAARISDLLLRPGEVLQYNGQIIRFPDIRVVYWCGGNPFHHHQDLNRLVQAFRRPRTVIVHESFWTATARYADIVLPATTTLERNDLGYSSKDNFLIAMKQVVAPLGNARNDYDIFSALSERLGIREAFTESLDEFGWLQRMYEGTRKDAEAKGVLMPDFDDFWEVGYFRFPEREDPYISFADFRQAPDLAPLKTPSGRIELYSERVASFGYSECPGHAAWHEPREWLGSPLASRFSIHLISNQPKTRLHSQLDQVGVSRTSKIKGREPARMNPIDAQRRNISDGDIIRIFNDRGSCLAGAIISASLRPGVIELSTGAWYDPVDPGVRSSLDKHGSVNVLTHDFGTSRLSQGPAAHSTLVEVEKFDGQLPEISVNQPPLVVSRP